MGRREARRARHGAAAARVRDFISQPERRGRGRGARRVAALRSRAVYCQQTVSVGPSDGPVVGPEARQPCPTMGRALAHDAPGQSSLRQARGCSSSVVSCGIGARWWLESEGLKRSAGRKSEREATAHRERARGLHRNGRRAACAAAPAHARAADRCRRAFAPVYESRAARNRGRSAQCGAHWSPKPSRLSRLRARAALTVRNGDGLRGAEQYEPEFRSRRSCCLTRRQGHESRVAAPRPPRRPTGTGSPAGTDLIMGCLPSG